MSEGDWRPIESAPKDGRQILAFARGEWGFEYYGVAQWALDGPGKIQPHIEGWFWSFAIRPTHWMHLPSPPDHRAEMDAASPGYSERRAVLKAKQEV